MVDRPRPLSSLRGDPRRSPRLPAAAIVALAMTAIFVLAAGSLLVASAGSDAPIFPSLSLAGPASRATSLSSPCAPPGTTSPDSLLIPLAQPTGSLGSNVTSAKVGATFEFRATNGSSVHLPGVSVHIPTTNANFFLQGGTKVQVQFAPRNASLPMVGWSSPFSASHSLSPKATFSSTSATLSTAWLAVTVNASHGTVQLEFRWQWWIQTTGGSSGTQTGPWSSPVTVGSTHAQPTTFYPAPWVGVASKAGSKVSSGSAYWMVLTGNVSATNFRLVVETTNGHEVNSVCRTTSSTLNSFNATVPLTYTAGGALPTGAYVVHVHNAGAAVVVFETVMVT